MEENKNLEINQENAENVEKKKSSAEIILEKLQQRKTIDSSNEIKAEELKKISIEIEKEAAPNTMTEEDAELDEEEIQEEEIEVKSNKTIPNYAEFSREQLVDAFEKLLEQPIEQIKEEAEIIKNSFFTKHNAEILEQREIFVENGGQKEDFKVEPDKFDDKFKELYDRFKELKHLRNIKLQEEKQINLEEKYKIIDQIEELINKGETLNRTFEEFYKIRDKWNEIGAVPQADSKALLEKYNFTLQKFYDWVNINKELRDLDLRKNLEQKIRLCEQAEALILETKITKAYNNLQKYHDKWKGIGPVIKDKKEEIWNRFKEASTIINKKHYDYFQELKRQQSDNLKAKELLCEEAENISKAQCTTVKEWQNKTEEINELLKLWKLIGFAPKKFNNQVFERFITARKTFFDNKHEFFQNYADNIEKNLQIKEQLVIEAENLKDSTDWNKTSDLLIELQEKWRNIGAVPKDKKDEIWNRFRTACNHFFERKRENLKNKKEQEIENLNKKNEIIEKIKNLEPSENAGKSLKALQELQKEWSEIGFVPFKEKDAVYTAYQKALEEKYKSFDISKSKRNEAENKIQIESIVESKQPNKIKFEIEKVKNNIAKYNSEIITLENNLSFFVKSKNSESILKNFESKIEKLKQEKTNNEQMLTNLVKALKELQKK